MRLRIVFAALAACALAACGQGGGAGAGDQAQLDAPAPETAAALSFTASNEAAQGATGDLTYSLALRMPDASQANADAQEVLTLTGATGLVVEAQISGVMSPATQVQGQTLRALLGLAVEEPQVLVYRVTQETKPASGQGLCGAGTSNYLVVWEPSAPSESSLRLLGVSGGAPGASGSRPCTMLDYRRT
jgi:hypothetical protein